jgi:hypothetical protein
METKLSDLLFVFDDALSKDVCQRLIEKFEINKQNHILINQTGVKFNQLILNNLDDTCEEFHKVITSISKFSDLYLNKVGRHLFPESYLYEEIRIKRYEKNSDEQFDTHVDVVDHQTSKRFLSFLFYLNDVDEGGQTVFDFGHVVPKCGRLIMFPPLWMYPHKGEIPLSNQKYIMSTYLHYR